MWLACLCNKLGARAKFPFVIYWGYLSHVSSHAVGLLLLRCLLNVNTDTAFEPKIGLSFHVRPLHRRPFGRYGSGDSCTHTGISPL